MPPLFLRHRLKQDAELPCLWLQFNFSDGLSLFTAKENYSFLRFAQEMSAYFLGNLVVFLLPGLIWVCVFCKKKYSFPVLLFYSFLISVISLIFITTVFKISVHGELNWLNFVMMLGILTFSGLIALFCKRTVFIQMFRFSKINVLIGLLSVIVMVACGWIFQDKIIWVDYDDDFAVEHILSIPLGAQSDLLENFGLVDSLKRHLLPYWDLEYADRFGYAIIDPPLHMFTSLFLILFVGQSFAAQSLNSILVMLISFWFVWRVSGEGLEQKRYYITGCIVPFLFIPYILVFLNHPESTMVLLDLTHFLSFFMIAQFYFLLKKRYNLFLIFALLGFLTKYEAILFTCLGLWFYQSVFVPERGRTAALFRNYLFLISPYIVCMLAIGVFRGDLSSYSEAFFVERFMRLDYFNILPRLFSEESTSMWGSFSVANTVEFLKHFMLGSAFLGVVLFLPQKDKISRFFSKIAIVYFILVMICKVKRIHYTSPLVFMSAIVALRMFFLAELKERNILKVFKPNKGAI